MLLLSVPEVMIEDSDPPPRDGGGLWGRGGGLGEKHREALEAARTELESQLHCCILCMSLSKRLVVISGLSFPICKVG